MTYRKKLIEVALPLDAINEASAREKSISQGHPSTFHLWFARRPLATCRAVIFASLVDDPSAHPDLYPTEKLQEDERRRLFKIIEQLVRWENSNNPTVLSIAREEIRKSVGDKLPILLDPFCGGGSIPFEAQRLGLEAHASDLNPVPVLINKALIEIPPKFAGRPPINTASRSKVGANSGWVGARGLAEDVRYFSQLMRDEAEKRIGHFYPKVVLPKEQGEGEARAIAWLWTRTVTCPNPVCKAQMPLASSFWLSTKTGKKTWVEPIVDHLAKTVRFEVKNGQGVPVDPPKIGRGASFRCLVCGQVVTEQYIKSEGTAKRMSAQLMAIVAEGPRGRIYSSPNEKHVTAPAHAIPEWAPEQPLANDPRNIWCIPYGLKTFADLFTQRQLVSLTTFGDLVEEMWNKIQSDAVAAGLSDDGLALVAGGTGATAYADAIATYLAMSVSRLANRSSTVCFWDPGGEKIQQVFARQAIPMTWDYVEGNPFSNSTGNFLGQVSYLTRVLELCSSTVPASVLQLDATAAIKENNVCISTDPPYYDNINYADLSDFFYVWLRRSLSKIYPDLFSTLLVPKTQELVATPHRFGGSKDKAQRFFEEGLGKAFSQMRQAQRPDLPLTVYYAFKQAESGKDAAGNKGASVASTGWETMLEGLIQGGFTITGTWPMRTELIGNLKKNVGALASSIVLVCRPRSVDAPLTTRRDFLNALKRELPSALQNLQHGNIAPVDLAQATIGPGMAIFSRYSKVMEADGSRMRVRTALQLINHALDEVLTEQEGEFDTDTRWAVAWFEQFGTGEGAYGVAETLSKAKNSSISGLVEAGLLTAKGGKVRLLRRDELPIDWDPSTDKRLTVWETAQHLIRALERGGENGAAALLAKMGEQGEVARDLAYRLYTLCERKGWAEEALAYNSLVIAWQGIGQLASRQVAETPRQQEMFT